MINYSTHQRNDDLAIRVRLELVRLLQARAQLDMVINLAIDGEDNLSIGAHERLCASVYATLSMICIE